MKKWKGVGEGGEGSVTFASARDGSARCRFVVRVGRAGAQGGGGGYQCTLFGPAFLSTAVIVANWLRCSTVDTPTRGALALVGNAKRLACLGACPSNSARASPPRCTTALSTAGHVTAAAVSFEQPHARTSAALCDSGACAAMPGYARRWPRSVHLCYCDIVYARLMSIGLARPML